MVPARSMMNAKHPAVSAAALLVTLLVGWGLGRGSVKPATELPSIPAASSGATLERPNLSLFWLVWETLGQTYIDPAKIDPQALLYGAIGGFVDSVGDPYTVFMTPEQNADFRSILVGSLEGIGAELDLRDGLIVVVAPLRGSPAERAGLLPQDVITAVDAEPVDGQTLNDVVHRIRGQKGTTVELSVLRGPERKGVQIKIMRDSIQIPSVEATERSTSAGPVGVISLNQYGDTTVVEFEQALRGFLEDGVVGLIVDERGNGGGYLEGAVDLAAFFLPKDSLVVSVRQRDGESEEHRTKLDPIAPSLPVVVLVNQGTASAAEIFAGALQDQKRGTVIGTKTFGKGTVQDVLELPGGSSLKVTTARWMTPAGRDIGADKVTPDTVVDRSIEDFTAGRDPQMDAALAVFGEPVAPPLERGDE